LIGFFTMVNSLLNSITNNINQIQNIINTDIIESVFVWSYNDLLTLEEDVKKSPDISKAIHFNRVDYTYPQSTKKALNDFNMHIFKGEKIAIVGKNGSGKTTCMNMLLSLMNPENGQVVGTENIISCINQDFSHYQMTIKENIIMGYPSKIISDNEIRSLLEKVGLKKEIEGLENGIYTNLGQLDKGIELSKGQWQRLAIARLMANPEATVWILDEPTAYLDPIIESKLYNIIYQLAGDRTVLFISHRLGFTRKADRILVFDDGQLVEQGNHNELITNNKYYSQIYKIQKSWYS